MPYREWMRLIAPPWLQGPNSGRYLADVGDVHDQYRQRMVDAVKARMPELAPYDAVPIIASERGLEQGAGETRGGWATRLRHAWATWISAGSHPALLRQLEVAGFTGEKFIMQRNGRRSTIAADVVTFFQGPFWTFDWRPPTFYTQWGLIFTGTLPSVTWSSGAGFSDAAAKLNRICQKWRPGKALFMGTWILESGTAFWGWPVTRVWGGSGVVWGGGATSRHIPPA